MTIIAEIEFGTECQSPKSVEIQAWATTTLAPLYPNADTELCIRVVSETEMVELNHAFREKEKSTNVLSFPANIPEQPQLNILGDIAICAAVVEREALEQSKELSAHWAHMVIHGCLHLAGYDHVDETEALEMETLEINILAELGYPNPYQTHTEFTDHVSATSH